MPYYISNSDSSINISLPDGVIDTETYSVTLVGRNVSNYGQYFAENSIRMLENFASTSAPKPDEILTGQIWYDKEKNILRVWDGAATLWRPATGITIEDTGTPVESAGRPSIKVEGGMFFNRENNKLYVYADSLTAPWAASYAGEVSRAYSKNTIVGQPDQYGTKIRNIFLQSTTGPKAVSAITYSNDSTSGGINVGNTRTRFGRETIVAIISDHAPFIVRDTRALSEEDKSFSEGEYIDYYAELFTDPAGIARKNNGKILPGINIRDYTKEGNLGPSDLASVPRADIAEIANAALNIAFIEGGPNTVNNYLDIQDGQGLGTINNIEITELVVNTDNIEPSLDQAFSLGTCDNRFTDVFANTVRTDYIFAGSNMCSLSNPANPMSIVGQVEADGNWKYLDDVTIDGTLTTTVLTSGSNNTAGTITGEWIFTSGSDLSMTGTAPITVRTITTGSSSTSGTLEGQWELTPGSTLQATYADLAELYLPDQQYEPGTVVRLGGDAEITSTISPACDQVFGVISTAPAYILNSALEHGLPVALAGRVPVKVTGPVKKGDRLVSSHEPGIATSLEYLGADYDPRIVIGRSIQHKNDTSVGVVEAVIGVI